MSASVVRIKGVEERRRREGDQKDELEAEEDGRSSFFGSEDGVSDGEDQE